MNKQMTDSNEWNSRNKNNILRLGYWTGAWVLATAGAVFGPRFLWEFKPLLTILGVLIQLGIGFGMVMAFKQHLQGLDEMQHKIQVDAMALSMGIGLVVASSYQLLEDIKLITFEPEIPHIIILMALTYMIGVFLGNRRYQ